MEGDYDTNRSIHHSMKLRGKDGVSNISGQT